MAGGMDLVRYQRVVDALTRVDCSERVGARDQRQLLDAPHFFMSSPARTRSEMPPEY
jgi:hypothetical protein